MREVVRDATPAFVGHFPQRTVLNLGWGACSSKQALPQFDVNGYKIAARLAVVMVGKSDVSSVVEIHVVAGLVFRPFILFTISLLNVKNKIQTQNIGLWQRSRPVVTVQGFPDSQRFGFQMARRATGGRGRAEVVWGIPGWCYVAI